MKSENHSAPELRDAESAAANGADPQAAFTALYRSFRAPVAAYVGRRVPEPGAADVCQDIWLKVFLHVHSVEDPRRLQGWMWRVARNTMLDHVGAQGRRIGAIPPERCTAAAASEPPPDEVVAAADELRGVVRAFCRAVNDLPVVRRRLYADRVVLGRGFDDLSASFGPSRDAIQMRLSRTRAKLRRALSTFGYRADAVDQLESMPALWGHRIVA